MLKEYFLGKQNSQKFLFAILSVIISGIITATLYPFLGATSGAVIVIPVSITAWTLGWQAGAATSILGMIFNAGVFARFGYYEYTSTFINTLVLIGISLLIGWMRSTRDRERQLLRELNQKNKLLSYVLSDSEEFSSALIEQATELNKVLNSAKAITSSLDFDETVAVIAKEIASSLQASGCTVSSWNKEADHIQTLIDYRLEDLDGFDYRGNIYPLSKYPTTRRVLEHGEIITIYQNDPDADPVEVELIKAQNTFSFLMLPIIFENEIIGLVEVDDIEERKFTEEDIKTAKKLVEYAGIALNKANIFNEIQFRLKEQTLLTEAITTITASLDRDITLRLLCEQLCNALDASSVYVCTVNEEMKISTVIAEYFSQKATPNERVSDLGKSYVIEAQRFIDFIHTGIPMVDQLDALDEGLSEFQHMAMYDAKTALYIPLKMKQETKGFILIWDSQQKRVFSENEINLGKILAEHTTIALEKSYLLDQVMEAEARFRSIAENSPDHILLLDKDLVIRYVNHASPGMTIEQLIGSPLYTFVEENDRKRVEQILRDVIRTRRPDVYETEYITGDRDVIYYESRVSPLLSGNSASGLVVNSRDISHHKELEKQLEFQALHDPLTGLPNRRFMEIRLAETIKLVMRQKLKLEIAILDLDNFKEINDTYGHPVGDQVLIELGKRLKKSLRGSDFPARFGGDEFIVLFVDDQKAPGKSLHERFEAIFATPIQVNRNEIFVTASIGYSSYRGEGEVNGEQIIKQADDAMYGLKSKRKNAAKKARKTN